SLSPKFLPNGLNCEPLFTCVTCGTCGQGCLGLLGAQSAERCAAGARWSPLERVRLLWIAYPTSALLSALLEARRASCENMPSQERRAEGRIGVLHVIHM